MFATASIVVVVSVDCPLQLTLRCVSGFDLCQTSWPDFKDSCETFDVGAFPQR